MKPAMQKGELLKEKAPVHRLTSGGAHLLAGIISAIKHGYQGNGFLPRLREQLDILVYRLKADIALMDQFYRRLKPTPKVQMYSLDAKLWFLGHAFENLNEARRSGLFSPHERQARRLREGEQLLYRVVGDLKGKEFEWVRQTDKNLFHRLVGDSAYAYRALRLM